MPLEPSDLETIRSLEEIFKGAMKKGLKEDREERAQERNWREWMNRMRYTAMLKWLAIILLVALFVAQPIFSLVTGKALIYNPWPSIAKIEAVPTTDGAPKTYRYEPVTKGEKK